MTQKSLQEIRFGSTQALPEKKILRAGPVTVLLENGELRYIKLAEKEIIRGIYAAVRDENWGTVIPIFEKYEVEQSENTFLVHFIAHHKSPKADFTWKGKIKGKENGEIIYEMVGNVNNDFLKNRIGFCVLHPMELAGTPVTVGTPDGEIIGNFPTNISPHQPFKEMTSIRHFVTSDIELELNFSGELYEMEDQRNWTDASFKTYCTPLRIPYPVQLKKGDRIKQMVHLKFIGDTSRISPIKGDQQDLKITVGSISGKLPCIGIGNDSSFTLTRKEQGKFSKLGFSHLHEVINICESSWKKILSLSVQQATIMNIPLELEIIGDDQEDSLREFVEALSQLTVNVVRIIVFPSDKYTTTSYLVENLKELLNHYGLRISVGGGSRAYFTELNRAELPLGLLDFVSYSINPQVHAFDNASLIETLGAQAETVKSAKQMVKNIPIIVSPITFKPRFNPNATTKVKEKKEDKVDGRQRSLFGAGWTLGSLHNLAKEGVSSITYYETTGCLGIVDVTQNSVYPIYHVFADIAPFYGGKIHNIELSSPFKIEALAVSLENRLRILVVNLTNEELIINLETQRFKTVVVRSLNEMVVKEASEDPINFINKIDYIIKEPGNALKVKVMQTGILRLDLELEVS
jgi:hypothetical protein